MKKQYYCSNGTKCISLLMMQLMNYRPKALLWLSGQMLVTPQPDCRLILPLLSSLARHHRGSLWQALQEPLPRLQPAPPLRELPQFPGRSFQGPTRQGQFLWVVAQMTLLTLTGAEADLLHS